MTSSPPNRTQTSTDHSENVKDTEHILSTAVQSAHSSFATTYSALQELSQRFQTSLDTTQTLVTQALKSSLHVASNLETIAGGIRLTVALTNIGQMPLTNVLCSLAFEMPRSSHHKEPLCLPLCGMRWTLVSCTATLMNGDSEETLEAPSPFDGPLAMLPPGIRYVLVVHMKSDAPVQCNGILTTTFAGLREPLDTIHRFGVYLVDQIVKEPLLSEKRQIHEQPLYVREYLADFVLDMFGARPGTDLLLRFYQSKDDEHEMTCRIQGSDQKNYARIEFAAESNQGHELLALLVEELDILGHTPE
ncbi:hypothetical protein BX666DRAFT_2030840 [Dichotomocladium elegans]|nr:hypothetical protein BX666DRAFT_2030840 [Dichotomocladium elegans]